MCAVQYRRKAEFVTVGITLALAGAAQAAAILALGHKGIPILTQLAAAYTRWGGMLVPARAGEAMLYVASGILTLAFHWVAGTLIHMFFTRPGPMVRGTVAHGVASAVIIVGGFLV